MPQKRLFGSAAVFTCAVAAGIIESRSGSASVTPMPCRKVRRGRCFLVMNMLLLHGPPKGGPHVPKGGPHVPKGGPHVPKGGLHARSRCHPHLERRTLHDAQDQ